MTVDAMTPTKLTNPRTARGLRRRVPFVTIGLVGLALGLSAFNAWWYWRESRAVESLGVIEGWVGDRRFVEAEGMLRERLRRSPHDAESRVVLARLLAARGDLRDCASELHKVPFWSPRKPESLYQEGNVCLMMDRAKDAEAAWQGVIRDDPLHPVPIGLFRDSVFELLKLYSTEDRWDDAHVVTWRAYEEASTEDRSVLLMWRMRSELERVAPAESAVLLRRYVAADPGDWQALRALARAEQAIGERAEALRHFEACLKGSPDDPRVWRDYLAFLHEQGVRQPWLALLARTPKAADSEPEVWKFRGLARELAGDLAGASGDYRRAIERDPFVVEYHYRLSIIEERLGRHDQAVEQRRTTQKLRDARARLPNVYYDYQEARTRGATDPRRLADSMRRLGSVCRTLGFSRAADAWEQLAGAS